MNQLEDLGYLSTGSRIRRIYEKLQVEGDQIYNELGIQFKSSWFPIFQSLLIENQQSITSLTERIAFTNITVKNIVRDLESSGLVTIYPNPNDKRSKIVSLTSEGQESGKKLNPIWETFSKVLNELFNINGNFLDSLGRIDQALQKEPLSDRFFRHHSNLIIKNADEKDYEVIGELMVKVYSNLDDFLDPNEHPGYYDLLRNVGELTKKPNTEIFAAYDQNGKVLGAVVFIDQMKNYASGGSAPFEKNAVGFRLLAVDQEARGKKVGKLLSRKCILRAKELEKGRVLIHSTKAMQTAWKMYEKLGFKRYPKIDFKQGDLEVFGFKLNV